MKKIRVLHTEWSDGWGGQEIRIFNEMTAVRKRAVEVMLACRETAQIRQKAEEAGIPVFTFPFRGNTDLRTLAGLMRLIHREKIDIVNTHSGKDTWVGGLAAKLAGAKFIRTRHLSNPINASRLNFINSLADFVVTTGESVREAMIRDNRIDPEKILSIPTGIDEERFSPDCCNREELRRELEIAPERFVIGNLAVLRGFKRQDNLIRAIAMLVGTHPELLLLIAGEGPQRPILEALIKERELEDHVFLLGHTERPERFLKALDLFVLSSDSKEGVPQSLIQALMMEIPSVATDVGSVSDLYAENFHLIPSTDPSSLAEAIRELVEDEELRNRYARNARKTTLEHFTLDAMAEKTMQVYRKILR